MPEWLTDPAAWRSRPLHQRLELLRRHYCNGPCGQSSAVHATRAATDGALSEAIYILAAPPFMPTGGGEDPAKDGPTPGA